MTSTVEKIESYRETRPPFQAVHNMRALSRGEPLPYPQIPITRARLKEIWVIDRWRRQRCFHLIKDVRVAWLDGDQPKILIQTACGDVLDSLQTSELEPADRWLCDRCALHDMLGPQVYRMYGGDDQLLYVGYTGDAITRFQQHRTQSPWWPLVRRHTLTSYPSEVEGLKAELDAIDAESPRFNKRRPNRRHVTAVAA